MFEIISFTKNYNIALQHFSFGILDILNKKGDKGEYFIKYLLKNLKFPSHNQYNHPL